MSEIYPKAIMSFRYKDLRQLCAQLATKAIESESDYEIAEEGLLRRLKEVDKCLEELNFERPSGVALRVDVVALQPSQNCKDESESVRITGIKTKKKTYKSRKQPKNSLERATKKRRKVYKVDKNSSESVQNLLTQLSQHTHIAQVISYYFYYII